MPLTYFDFMISVLIVLCNHIHHKAFDGVNISKVFKNLLLLLICLFLYLLANYVILLSKLVPDFNNIVNKDEKIKMFCVICSFDNMLVITQKLW